jgi:hypothetical protein
MGIAPIVAIAFWVASLQPEPAIPLTSSNITLKRSATGRTNGVFDLTNTSEHDVTAWGVTFQLALASGGTRSTGSAVDAYIEYAKAAPDTTGDDYSIRAHQSKTVRLFVLRSAAADAVAITGMSFDRVVFADGSAIGNPDAIDRTFQRRKRDSSSYAFVLAALRAGRTAGADRRGLQVALERINAKGQDDYDHPFKTLMRHSIETVLDGTLQTEPRQLFESWLPSIEQKRVAADEYSRRNRGEK